MCSYLEELLASQSLMRDLIRILSNHRHPFKNHLNLNVIHFPIKDVYHHIGLKVMIHNDLSVKIPFDDVAFHREN